MSMWSESASRLQSILIAHISRRSLDLAVCGARTLENPKIDATTGYLSKQGIYSKPPRWVLHLQGDDPDRIEIHLPSHPQANRLGYFNAQSGRQVGALWFRVVVALHASHGWYIVPNAEWAIIILRGTPIPSGTSSETIDEYNPHTGQLFYRGKELEYDCAILVALDSPESTIKSGPFPITYGHVSHAIKCFLNVKPSSSIEPKGIPLFDLDSLDGERELHKVFDSADWLTPIQLGKTSIQFEVNTPSTVAAYHNTSVKEQFIERIRSLSSEEFLGFMYLICNSIGIESISLFKEQVIDGRLICEGRGILLESTSSQTTVVNTVRILAVRGGSSLVMRDIKLFLNELLEEQKCYLFDLSFGNSERLNTKLGVPIEQLSVIGIDDIVSLCEANRIGIHHKEVNLLEFQEDFFNHLVKD